MLPLPLAVQVPPPAPTHVQLSLVMAGGKLSATVAPITALGPALEAGMVYVTLPPGVAAVTPAVLVMLKSAFGLRVSVSVEVVLPVVGSVTPLGGVRVAVWGSVPVALGEMVAETV